MLAEGNFLIRQCVAIILINENNASTICAFRPSRLIMKRLRLFSICALYKYYYY